MGGCATRLKVSKGGDDGERPAPEPGKEEAVAGVVSETRAVDKKDEAATTVEAVAAEVGWECTEGVKEIVVDEYKVDDQAGKRGPLSLLFNKENEEKSSTAESEKPFVEPTKPEVPSAMETTVREPDTATAVEAHENVEQEKVIEAAEAVAAEPANTFDKKVEAEKVTADEQQIKA